MIRRSNKGKYKSALENKVAKVLGSKWKYELASFPYVLEKRYTPDFTKGLVHLEVKGFFRPGEVSKYKAVKSSFDTIGEELIFVLANPNKKVRRGAKSTMADWCERNGYKWISVNDLHSWLKSK